MRRWTLSVFLFALPALALGQGLGDTARRERERRETPGNRGTATRTITEDDLVSSKGQIANDPNRALPAPAEEDEAEKEWQHLEGRVLPGGVRILKVTPSDPSKPKGEAYWRAQVMEARLRLAIVKRDYEDLDRQIRLGQPVSYDENGRRVIRSQQAMKLEADAAQQMVEHYEQELEDVLEEARRDGALPGWLREDGRSQPERVLRRPY